MTTNQTIDGAPRELLEAFAAYVADSPNAIMRARVKELRTLLDADKVNSRKMGLMEFVEAHPIKPAAQPQGDPVTYDPAKENKQFEAWARTQSLVDLRLCDIGLYYERQTGLAHDAWQYRAKLSEQPAPIAVVTTYKPGLYAVRHIDNWDGERDVALTFAMLDADGKWTDNESGAPLLTYQGDKILRAWPLDCSEAPDTQIIGVPRNWLEDWALELVEAAQDGGTMSNQVEHLLQLHPKQ